jgi:hypothetical protein
VKRRASGLYRTAVARNVLCPWAKQQRAVVEHSASIEAGKKKPVVRTRYACIVPAFMIEEN